MGHHPNGESYVVKLEYINILCGGLCYELFAYRDTHISDCHIPDFIVSIVLLSSHRHSEAPVWHLKWFIQFLQPVPFALGLYVCIIL